MLSKSRFYSQTILPSLFRKCTIDDKIGNDVAVIPDPVPSQLAKQNVLIFNIKHLNSVETQ